MNSSNSATAVVKDPSFIAYLGIVLLIPGVIALIPFNILWLQALDIPFYVASFLGLVLLVLAKSKVGWWINVEDNILYYSKFSVFSNWQKRRGVEYAISIDKIYKVEMKRLVVSIYYHPNKKISFHMLGLSKKHTAVLKQIFQSISSAL